MKLKGIRSKLLFLNMFICIAISVIITTYSIISVTEHHDVCFVIRI